MKNKFKGKKDTGFISRDDESILRAVRKRVRNAQVTREDVALGVKAARKRRESRITTEMAGSGSKGRPKSYTKYMLGLHSSVWKGVRVEDYVRKERDAWRRTLPQETDHVAG